MEVYTLDGNKNDFNTSNLFKQGFFGKIYLTDDNKCFKVFKQPLEREESLDFEEDTFNEIKELKLDNFYELYDLYYNEELTQILGYLSRYYQSENIDILTMPTDYTLNNLCLLYNSFKKLSEHNIYTNDMHSNNVIVNRSNIIVIDVDLYYKGETIEEGFPLDVFRENISNLNDLFLDIYFSSLNNHIFSSKYDKINMARKIQRLFTMTTTSSVEPIIKKLIKYKYPIDYLRKK